MDNTEPASGTNISATGEFERNGLHVIATVEVDLGISLVPAPSVELERDQGTVAVLPLKGEQLVRPLGILKRRGRNLSTATQKLLEVLTSDVARTS